MGSNPSYLFYFKNISLLLYFCVIFFTYFSLDMQWHDHYKDLFSTLGFRDKDLSSRGHHDQMSTESLHNHGKNSGHSRNLSDGSGSSQQGGVPTGTRVQPLGRETTPTPNAPQRIPREVWDRFEGKTREVITDLKLFQRKRNLFLLCQVIFARALFKVNFCFVEMRKHSSTFYKLHFLHKPCHHLEKGWWQKTF